MFDIRDGIGAVFAFSIVRGGYEVAFAYDHVPDDVAAAVRPFDRVPYRVYGDDVRRRIGKRLR